MTYLPSLRCYNAENHPNYMKIAIFGDFLKAKVINEEKQ